MITPKFRVEQDSNNIYVIIEIKNLKSLNDENFQLYHHENEFIFYSKPYFLRLELPGELISSDNQIIMNDDDDDDNDNKFKYNNETNELRICIRKKNFNEHFPNLEMIELLLAKSKTKPGKRLIEVLNSSYNDDDEDDQENIDEEEFDWTLEQTISNTENENIDQLLNNEHPYGFGNCFRNILSDYHSESMELFDVKNPGEKPIKQRRNERIEKENHDFNDDYYLASLYEDDELIDSLIKLSAPWYEWNDSSSSLTDNDNNYFNNHIKPIIPIDYGLIDKKALILNIFDILFGYCYDLRTNDFEHTVESSWTIIKLSSTLCCFEYFVPLKDDYDNSDFNDIIKFMVITCVRRSLIYPLYRNWQLSMQILNDVIEIMFKGANAILKCFIDIHQLLSNDLRQNQENLQIINDLYITNFCHWIKHHFKSKLFRKLSIHVKDLLEKNEISKDMVNLDLIILEKAAMLAIEEADSSNNDNGYEEISKGLKSLLMRNNDNNHSDKNDSDDDE